MNAAGPFVGIYNADGGVGGELRFVLGKVTGSTHCALCDLTHGWNPFGSKRWKRALAAAAVELTLLHRNEADSEQLEATTALPSVLQQVGAGWREVITAAELNTISDSPETLLARLATLA